MSSILYLRLDNSWDLIWDPVAQLSDIEAVAQAIKTRILLFQQEWWENLKDGTPMFQEILGYRKTAGAQQLATMALTQRILGTPYVTAVENVSVSFNPVTRSFIYSATAQTSFGQVTVTNAPGAAAGSVNNQ